MKIRWSTTLLIVGFVIFARAEKREVSFSTADGIALQGSLYTARNPGPGVLLVPECKGNRKPYDQLATMLSTAGYSALSFDFQDLGDAARETAQPTPEQQKAMAGDIEAALSFMKTHRSVNPRILAVLASNCAVNEAVHASQRHPEIRALVLMSGGVDAAGEAHIKNSPDLPILGVASEEDKEAAAAVRKLVELSTNGGSQLEMLDQAGHAASMFANQIDLGPDIVIWFRSKLSVAGYGLPPAIR